MPENNFKKSKLISRRYRIIKKIASGGMADVFLGDDLKLSRKIAIKILAANYAGDKNFVVRFKSEAQILARLNHPNIVQVYDWGEFDSSYFICMEYIEGDSLKEIIEKKGPLPPETVVDYAIQISSALLMAHKSNLIHRDIKPQNILVTTEGEVKVTDFGIAKSLSTDITKTLNIMGTAHYISPEQARGEILDHRTDIYSMGIVLYEMLTADVPFRGGTSIDISLKHIYEKPKRRKKKKARAFGEKLRLSQVSTIIPIVMSIFILSFLTLFIVYSSKYFREAASNSMATVPPVETIPAANAEVLLSLFDFNMVIKDEIYDSELPEGFIIDQPPESGKNIPVGGKIKETISRGPEITGVSVPNLVGLSLEEALQALEDY